MWSDDWISICSMYLHLHPHIFWSPQQEFNFDRVINPVLYQILMWIQFCYYTLRFLARYVYTTHYCDQKSKCLEGWSFHTHSPSLRKGEKMLKIKLCKNSVTRRFYELPCWQTCPCARRVVVVYSLSRVRLFVTMDCSMPGFHDCHSLSEFAQTHVHWIDDVIQPSHLLSPPPPLALSCSQHEGPFQWVGTLHQMAKVLERQH